MKRRKFLLGSTAVFASGGLLTGTGAFTSTAAEREVKIEVVGDEDAYLGLSEDQIEDEGVLYGTEMPRTAPEEFTITNQTTTAVDIDIKLLQGNLKFNNWDDDCDIDNDWVNDGDIDNVCVENGTLVIEGMEPGAEVSEVTIDIPGTSEFPVYDTLRFNVTGKDDDLYIEAERDLTLEPDEIEAKISGFANISATFEITNLEDVDHSTVEVNGLKTEFKGNKKYQITNPSNIDCSPSETITVTVTGKTEGGVEFRGTASGVNCSQQQGPNGEN